MFGAKKVNNTEKLAEIIIKILKVLGIIFIVGFAITIFINIMFGASKYNNILTSMMSMLSIMLGLVSIACIIVIYNSFAISVMERKKQFGLFSSIGATKKQLRKTVLYEASVLSLISIPLGIISAYFGIGIVVIIMNSLLKEALDGTAVKLCTYPTFVIVPIIFMIFTIFISAFIPARKASKISPIEAIRLNDDIKIKGKKVKSPRWIRRLFGVEGDMAYKNMKRNKKKYRITVASLFISIVLFISFSGYLTYTLKGATSYLSVPEFDIQISYNDTINKDIINKIKTNEDVKEYAIYKTINLNTKTNIDSMYTKEYREFLTKQKVQNDNQILVIIQDDQTYNNYLNKIGKKEPKPILYNNYSGIVYGQNSRKSYTYTRFDKIVGHR
jgi:putative ABC transport system permease protein